MDGYKLHIFQVRLEIKSNAVYKHIKPPKASRMPCRLIHIVVFWESVGRDNKRTRNERHHAKDSAARKFRVGDTY